jgi:hypothetical protein
MDSEKIKIKNKMEKKIPEMEKFPIFAKVE